MCRLLFLPIYIMVMFVDFFSMVVAFVQNNVLKKGDGHLLSDPSPDPPLASPRRGQIKDIDFLFDKMLSKIIPK